MISPKYAEELLKLNTNNRKIRQSKVDSLAESMKKGEWELSNDAITISEGNVLLNGQHRLLAVVKSGVPCNFILYTGAPDSSFGIMDTPSLRRVSDVISRMGGASSIAADVTVSKFLCLSADLENAWETVHRFHHTPPATRKECIETYERHAEDIHKWIRISEGMKNKGMQLITLTTVASFGLFLEKKMLHSEDKIKAFFKELLEDGKTQHGTILFARKKLMRHKMKTEVLAKYDDVRLMIRAWNDYVLGRETSYIKMNEDVFRYVRPV